MTRHRIQVDLPEWLDRVLDRPTVVADRQSRMRLAIDLARHNVRAGTGGPFAAVVVDDATGHVVSAGVNLVVRSGNCTAHAEMVAIELAEQVTGQYDLGAAGQPARELVSTVEPCAMCLGAIVWSGVRRVVCGAADADARAIGFDEGPKRADWAEQLECRGIEVVCGVLAEEAAAVLREYVEAGGPIYNARRVT